MRHSGVRFWVGRGTETHTERGGRFFYCGVADEHHLQPVLQLDQVVQSLIIWADDDARISAGTLGPLIRRIAGAQTSQQ